MRRYQQESARQHTQAIVSADSAPIVPGDSPADEVDAQHIALATVCRADLVVSWNFKHIVHYEKIRGFNSVNLREGYGMVDIRSPREVVKYEEEEL